MNRVNAIYYIFSALHYDLHNSLAFLLFYLFFILNFSRFILRRSLAYLLSFLFFLLFFFSFLASFPLYVLYRMRRTKETVTSQLAKLLIYSLFNQINERVEVYFYVPFSYLWFMVTARNGFGSGEDPDLKTDLRFTYKMTALFFFTKLTRLSCSCSLSFSPASLICSFLLFFLSALD